MGRRALIVDIDYLPQRRLRFALYHASFGTKDRDMERRAEERHKLSTEARKGLQAHDFLAIIGDYNDNPEVVTQMFPFIDREKRIREPNANPVQDLKLTYSRSFTEYHTYWAKTRPDGFATNMGSYSVGGLYIVRGGMSDHYPIMEDFLLPLPDNFVPKDVTTLTDNHIYDTSDAEEDDFSDQDTEREDDLLEGYNFYKDSNLSKHLTDRLKEHGRKFRDLCLGGSALRTAASAYAAYGIRDRRARRDSI